MSSWMLLHESAYKDWEDGIYDDPEFNVPDWRWLVKEKKRPPAPAGSLSAVTFAMLNGRTAQTVLPDATASFTFSTSSAG